MVDYLVRARVAVPGRDDVAHVHPPLPVPLARGAGARLRRRRSRSRRSKPAREAGLRARRRDRPGGRRVDVRHAISAASPGTARLHVDSLGRPRGGLTTTTLPKPGNALRLTLDLKLQQAAEKALQYGIKLAQANGQWAARGGAIVALDPSDGSILAMASSPTYDPSVYAGHVTPKALANAGPDGEDRARRRTIPSLNRAICRRRIRRAPSFKPVTALAAMQEHMLSPYSYLPCTATYSAPEDRSHRTFHNWDPNVEPGRWTCRPRSRTRATRTSTNSATASTGCPTDRGQPLQKWATDVRLRPGDRTSTSARRRAASCRRRRLEHRRFTAATDPGHWQVDRLWKPGDSIELAIGQGDLLVTPLQMARFYALLANGGKLVTPHLLIDVENPNGTRVPVPAQPAPKPVTDLDPAALQVVQQGLWEGTHLPFGTSYAVFGKFPVSIAGKTGTAREGRDAARATSASRTSPGGAGTARPTRRRSSSAP